MAVPECRTTDGRIILGMELPELAEIVETMAVQHSYPGFDVRSLRLGLPNAAVKSSARLFVAALKHESPLVRLVALRWFWDRPGDAKRYIKAIVPVLEDPDEWVRLEAVRTIGRTESSDSAIAESTAKRLSDPDVEVRKAAAKACGKLNCKADAVIVALRTASEDPDTEVRWKAQKALRQLGVYVA